MRFELTPSGLLHMHLGDGVAVDTIALADLVYLEIDAEGHPLSLDFVVAEDFLPFIKERGGVFEVPDRVDPDMPDAAGPRSQAESRVVAG